MTEEKEDSHREMLERIHHLESSLPKDELGNPDYSGHRKFHKDQASAQENFEASRRKIIANITSWAAIGLLTVLGSALAPYLAKLLIPQ